MTSSVPIPSRTTIPGSGAAVVTDERRKDPHDAEFTCDIEINDVRNRYLLTKGATQQEVCTFSTFQPSKGKKGIPNLY